MFGLTIISKTRLERLEKTVTELERVSDYRARELGKVRTVLRLIRDNSTKMNKNDIVTTCKDLLKEMK